MARERVGEEKDGVGRGGRGKLFRVEGWVRDHSCLPAQVSSQHSATATCSSSKHASI